MNKEEEEKIRDSYEVEKSIRGARNGSTEMKKKNYTRLVNGTSREPVAHRRDEWLKDNGLLLLDFDYKDDPNNRYEYVEKLFLPHLEEWGVVHMEESARGGAHITVRKIEGLSPKEIIRLYELRTGQPIDKSGLNLCKSCFLVPNRMVHYVDEDIYYSMEPATPVALTEKERLMLEEDEKKQERLHQEQVAALRARAEQFHPSESDSETIVRLVEKIEQSGVDIIRDYERWVNVGFIIGNIMGIAGLDYFLRLSLLFSHYSLQEADKKYFSLMHDSRGELGIGTLIMYAREEGVIL